MTKLTKRKRSESEDAGERVVVSEVSSPGHLLTVAEVAKRLSLCRDTVYRMCDRGELPHVRIANFLRVPAEDLEAFITGRRR